MDKLKIKAVLGRTHDLFAFSSLILAVIYLPVPQMTLATALIAILAAMIGGLAADLDEPSSDVWDLIPVGEIWSKIFSPVFGKHRHISHSLVGLVITYYLSKLIFTLLASIILVNMDIVWMAFMLGFISHLLADSLTREGIPLFWPLKIKFGIPPFQFLRFKTGSWIEKALIFPGLLVLDIYLLYHYYPKFLAVLIK